MHNSTVTNAPLRSIIIIPARYASTRFPGKPLALLGGVPIIARVAHRVADAADCVVVATDDNRIADVCREYGITSVMTRPDHANGTDRIREAYHIISRTKGDFDIVINVQGDEPFIDPQQIKTLTGFFADKNVQIATLCLQFPANGDYSQLADPNIVKVTKDDSGYALYFSRSVIPYLRNVEPKLRPASHKFLTHIGIYAYTPTTLDRIADMEKSDLEQAESLEQLRWLQAGIPIKVGLASGRSIGIDTPQDLEDAERLLNSSDFK